MTYRKRTLVCGVVTIAIAIGVTNAATATNEGAADHGLALGARYAHVTNRRTDEGAHMGGVVARARSEFLGLEGAIDYRSERLNSSTDLRTWPVTASVLLYPVRNFYGLAGLGWYNSTLDFESDLPYEDRTETEVGYHLGLGFEAPLSANARLTGDVRYQFIDYAFEEIPESLGEVDADAFALNLGVLFYLH